MLVTLLAALAFADPGVDVAVGAGAFGPAFEFGFWGPVVSAEAAVAGLVPSVEPLALAASTELGGLSCPGPACGMIPSLRLGVGPMWRWEPLDLSLQGRIRKIGGSPFGFNPAITVAGHVPVAGLDLSPWLILEGARYFDVGTGVRVTIPRGEGTRAREPRGCEPEGAWEFIPGGDAIASSFEAPTADSPRITVKPSLGRDYATEELRKALGEIGELVANMLKLKTLASAGSDVATRTVGGETALGVGGEIAGDIAGWEIPTSPDDVPGSMAANSFKLAQMAVDAMMKVVDEFDGQLVDVHAEVDIERVDFVCRPIRVCEGGVWQDGGWMNEPPTRTRVGGPRVFTRASLGKEHEARQALHHLGMWWAPYEQGRMVQFENTDAPCLAAPGFLDQVAAIEAERERRARECEDLAKRIAELESERRGLVGVSPELELDRRGFEREMADGNCDYEEAAAEDWEESAAKQEELAKVLDGAGQADSAADALDRAAHHRELAAQHRDAMAEVCQRADDLERRIDELEQGLERAPARIAEIDAELADLRARLEACERGR